MEYAKQRSMFVHIGYGIFAMCLACLPVGVAYIFWPRIGMVGMAVVYALGWFAFYRISLWAQDREDANKKLISGKDLRRRTKAFYEWLDSQGRRR